ncbi:MAG: VOC family protein [Candidatus Thermoplasmatota archaeon]|nr:VOC family protein [Candidatus Thermoplasmatota archaeon]
MESSFAGLGMRLLHTSIRTSDMDRTVAFYTEVLGMELVRRKAIAERNLKIAFLEAGGGHQIEVLRVDGQSAFQVPSYEERVFDHLAFEVSDLDGVLAACRKRGGHVLEEPFHLPGSTSLYAFIQDPDGITIELIQRA